jgi:hypothetical protein
MLPNTFPSSFGALKGIFLFQFHLPMRMLALKIKKRKKLLKAYDITRKTDKSGEFFFFFWREWGEG